MPIVLIKGCPSHDPIEQAEFARLEDMIKIALLSVSDLGLSDMRQVSVIPEPVAVMRTRANISELFVFVEGTFVGDDYPSRSSSTFQKMAKAVCDAMVKWAHDSFGPFQHSDTNPWIEVLVRPFPIGPQKVVKSGGSRATQQEFGKIAPPTYEVVTGGYACSERD